VDFEGNLRDETVSVGEATETQRQLERILTDTEELEEELKQIRIKFKIIDFLRLASGGLSSAVGFQPDFNHFCLLLQICRLGSGCKP
jgi:hypothetical protein